MAVNGDYRRLQAVTGGYWRFYSPSAHCSPLGTRPDDALPPPLLSPCEIACALTLSAERGTAMPTESGPSSAMVGLGLGFALGVVLGLVLPGNMLPSESSRNRNCNRNRNRNRNRDRDRDRDRGETVTATVFVSLSLTWEYAIEIVEPWSEP